MKLKYKILMAIIAVSIGLCLMIYQSYALWVVTLSGQENIVEVGCFNIEFIENTSSIALSNSYPVSDEKGMSGEAYSFTITNKCTVDSAYQVTLNTLNANTMGDDKVKYVIYKDGESKPSIGQLVNSAPVNADKANITVSDLKESYIIASGELKGASEENGTGESHTYNVYLWIDENAGNEVENTRFEASINIVNASTKIQPTAAETIEALAEANPDQLVYDGTVDNNLRYIGANPNNYVSFNGELWRIIGVFNNIDNGSGTKETRLKIIRDEPIGTYSWDNKARGTGSSTSSYGSNDWSDSALQQVLNSGAYYNRTSGECPYGQNGATTTCDFSNNGLTEEAKSMISNAKWNLGGTANFTSSSNGLTSHFYGYERGTTVYSGRPTEWTGSIGLMYSSDYGYATSGGSTTNRETCLNTELSNWNSSSVSDCKNNDWLYDSSNHQWTLTPTSDDSDRVFGVLSSGYVYNRIAISNTAVSPALYLSSNVKISRGDGSEISPFELSL